MKLKIKQTNIRRELNGTILCKSTDLRDADDSVYAFVKYEIGYGGRVTLCEPTHVEVVTQVLSKIDTTIYEGTEEEMQGIYAAAGLVILAEVEASKHCEPAEMLLNSHFSKMIAKTEASGEETYSPLMLNLAFPMIAGSYKLTCLILFGFGILSEATIKCGIKMSLKELKAALEMAKADNISFLDLCKELGYA